MNSGILDKSFEAVYIYLKSYRGQCEVVQSKESSFVHVKTLIPILLDTVREIEPYDARRIYGYVIVCCIMQTHQAPGGICSFFQEASHIFGFARTLPYMIENLLSCSSSEICYMLTLEINRGTLWDQLNESCSFLLSSQIYSNFLNSCSLLIAEMDIRKVEMQLTCGLSEVHENEEIAVKIITSVIDVLKEAQDTYEKSVRAASVWAM